MRSVVAAMPHIFLRTTGDVNDTELKVATSAHSAACVHGIHRKGKCVVKSMRMMIYRPQFE